jgi:hypothetical protein
MKTNYGIYAVWLDHQKPFVFENPRFSPAGDAHRSTTIPHAMGPIRVDGATANWPGIPPETIAGTRLTAGADAAGLGATFKVCWDEENLYVLVRVSDPTPMKNIHTHGALWSGDGIEIFVAGEEPDQGGALRFTDRHFLVGAPGAGPAPAFEAVTGAAADIEAVVAAGGDGYTIEAALPWKSLGVVPHAGTELRFDLAIDDSADGRNRRAQLMWNGTDHNSDDRTHWGAAKLLP